MAVRSPRRPPSPSVRSRIADAGEEFNSFLSDVSTAVSQQVDRWRQRVTEAALRYRAEGFHTARLDALLASEIAVDPAEALARVRGRRRGAAPAASRDRRSRAVVAGRGRAARSGSGGRSRGARRRRARSRRSAAGALAALHAGAVRRGPVDAAGVEAIRAAASAPGQRYNPLVIVGKAGRGKDSPAARAGARAQAVRAWRASRCSTARSSSTGWSARLATASIARWRQRLRRADAFLLDDVGALAGKERSQEELYLLYNLLLESGRQMAFTAHAAPSQLPGFEPRLATRLGGGLVLELGPPDREARVSEVERLLGRQVGSGSGRLSRRRAPAARCATCSNWCSACRVRRRNGRCRCRSRSRGRYWKGNPRPAAAFAAPRQRPARAGQRRDSFAREDDRDLARHHRAALEEWD